MAVNYIVVGISTVIFAIYVALFFFFIDIKKRVNKKAGTAIVFFMLAIILLVVRRLQQIFLETEIVSFIPYFTDYITLIFAILFFFGVFFLHKAVKEAGRPYGAGRVSNVLKKYRGKL